MTDTQQVTQPDSGPATMYHQDGEADIDKQIDQLIEKEDKEVAEDEGTAVSQQTKSEDITEEKIDQLLTEDGDIENGYAKKMEESGKDEIETEGTDKPDEGDLEQKGGEPIPVSSTYMTEQQMSNKPAVEEGEHHRSDPSPDLSTGPLVIDTPKTYDEQTEREASLDEQRESEASLDVSDKPQSSNASDGFEGPQSMKSDEDVDEVYALTADQQQAMMELETMKSEMEYPNLPDEEPPEYDVSERLKVLNEELKNDETPVNGERETRVGFKDNLVDLVAPPPVFSDDEEEEEKQRELNAETGEDAEDEQPAEVENNFKRTTENKVLIERDGKFELVNADDVAAMNGMNGGLPPAAVPTPAQTQERAPAPPREPRPATANGDSRAQRYVPARRAQSAHQSSRDEYSAGYRSPYALSDSQKEIKKERDAVILRRKRDEIERRKEEEAEKRRECDEAFQAWLSKKREQANQRRQEEREEEKEKDPKTNGSGDDSKSDCTEEERDAASAFQEWLDVKAKQRQKDKELERQKKKEEDDGYFDRSRKDCDKAFRAWLKKKNNEVKKCKEYKSKKQSVHMLYLRRSRKCQALARAISYSQAFRYVDYYGYRM